MTSLNPFSGPQAIGKESKFVLLDSGYDKADLG